MALSKEAIIGLMDNINVGDYDGDEEDMHWRADSLLLEAVDPDIKAAYRRVQERASWWAFA